MTTALIQSLIPYLPRYAEEEGDFYSVTREALIDGLCLQQTLDRVVAEHTVALIEALLDTLSVLNSAYLQKGEWCFVSFPAQLLATSILTALSDSESRLFATNFWTTQDVSNDKKDQQREVLQFIETARNEHHASQQAPAIRYCYVAWSLIKLDSNYLFYQREDTRKRFDKTAGDYGLVGGRANQNDIAITDKTTVLKALQSADSELIKNALPETLKRELREEAGLLFDVHYTFKPWRRLKPYRQVQGAAPIHALTEYYLDIFQINLTVEGYLFLVEKIKTDERFVLFSLEELLQGAASDGKIPYIKALYDDFGNDRVALKSKLLALADSFDSPYLFKPQKYSLTLPMAMDRPILAGVLGKEKALAIQLTARQLALLLGLAAHLRDFEFELLEQDITLHTLGWIEVKNASTLQAELISLAQLFKETDLPIENHHDRFFRCSISPTVVFFDEQLFSFTVKQADLTSIESKIPVALHRESFSTALGLVKATSHGFELTLEFVRRLEKLANHQYATDNEDAIKIEDTYKKGLHKEPRFLALGLRALIRREAGIMKFVLPYISNQT